MAAACPVLAALSRNLNGIFIKIDRKAFKKNEFSVVFCFPVCLCGFRSPIFGSLRVNTVYLHRKKQTEGNGSVPFFYLAHGKSVTN